MATERHVARVYDEFAQYHDLFYADRQAEVGFYTSLASRARSRVLELGCGTGAIVAAVAQNLMVRDGVTARAVGLDSSAAMLRQATQRCPRIAWVQSDMERPAVRGPFDLVFCAFNTLQMLQSEDRVLRTLKACRTLLGPGGVLAFDLYNASCQESAASSTASRMGRLAGRFTDAHGCPLEVREDAIEDVSGESVELDWWVMDVSQSPPERRARLTVRLRHYSPAAIERLVGASGLRILERYGDVRKSSFDEHLSRKQVVVCGL